MLVVVVDSATPAVTAALAALRPDGVEILAQRVSVDARAHGELLAPAVRGVLGDAGVKPGELAAVVAGLGPGPFTGLRVGLVTAAALGHSLAIPTYGVCSLDALGWRQPGTVLAATDARRKELYWALYADGERITGPAVDRPDEVAGRAAAAGAERVVGEGAEKYDLGLPAGEPRYPSPEALAALAADRVRGRAPGEPLTPLYLRRPDATLPGQPRKSVLQ
ncbi:tRNA (adenosine(37)-N6)-threonylcarbamoyltransferase complex dimerization subunit type 1 TsaB [Planosporangium sp. 12N6]|uniref:tRNA (adenosine(37)-N6)-threonylcarbamoyltransferase complex dimerization subunit type 1 TsaB n=1 Tax=Planosporangium spinosum TaxID=3402278 RepID=UPI003CF6B0F1